MTSEVEALAGVAAATATGAGVVTGVGVRRARWHVGLAARVPSLFEAAALLAVVLLLLPLFSRVAGFGLGRDARFAAGGLEVTGLPAPVLPALCPQLAGAADALLAERLCGSIPSAPFAPTAPAAPSAAADFPPALAQALASARAALHVPLLRAQADLNSLRARQREGEGDLRPLADAIGVLESRLQPYADRYQLQPASAAGPRALDCAERGVVEALVALAAPAAPPAARANALLLLGAAVDGRSATAALAANAPLPPSSAEGCASLAASLGEAAGLLGEARQSASDAQKNEAMRALQASAGWQWAGAMLLGFGLLRWSRHAASPALGVAVSLIAWAGAAWAARVPWPLAPGRDFRPARTGTAWDAAPEAFVLWLVAAGLLLLLLLVLLLVLPAAFARRSAGRQPAQAMSSRIGYAGLVFATGIGWLLLFDLSAHAHPVNRYLALYHQGHLWLGMLVFSVLLFLRPPLARSLGWGLSVGGEAVRRASAALGGVGAWAAFALLALAGLSVFGLALSNLRQLTSELGRIWLIVGAAWFFFLRAGPLAERLARSGPAGRSWWRYVGPLGFVVGVLLAAMLVTRDMGPLLIAGYAAGGFVAATLAAWWHLRSGRVALPYAAALGVFALWIGAVTLALFQLGNVDRVTAARLESLAAPFASTNDQLALVSWFQRAAPADGFGLGASPWCGHAVAGSCAGVPAQVHSDYTFTALVGVFGAAAAWAGWLACALWLHRLIRHHGRVTRGEPRLAVSGGQLGDDGQGLLSWVGVAWVVLTLCQLAVTVAGNLAVLPLTGVTFPFVSFGMTSLVVNLAFLALCLNVNLPEPARHG